MLTFLRDILNYFPDHVTGHDNQFIGGAAVAAEAADVCLVQDQPSVFDAPQSRAGDNLFVVDAADQSAGFEFPELPELELPEFVNTENAAYGAAAVVGAYALKRGGQVLLSRYGKKIAKEADGALSEAKVELDKVIDSAADVVGEAIVEAIKGLKEEVVQGIIDAHGKSEENFIGAITSFVDFLKSDAGAGMAGLLKGQSASRASADRAVVQALTSFYTQGVKSKLDDAATQQAGMKLA